LRRLLLGRGGLSCCNYIYHSTALMSGPKAALKAAKAALDAHHYQEAVTQAQKVLAADARNYHA